MSTSNSFLPNLSVRHASLADARALSSIFVKSFQNDLMCYWLYQWPPLGSPERPRADQETTEIRVPSIKRSLTNPKYHFQLVTDDNAKEVVAFAGWISPGTPNAKHLLRKLTFRERVSSWIYWAYDKLAALIPNRIFCALYPETAALYERRNRWLQNLSHSTDTFVDPSHREQGFWQLAFLGVLPPYERRGIASKLLEWGLNKADEEDRAVYVSASAPGARLYQRHGFEVIRREICFEGELHGGFEDVFLCRKPRSERDEK